MKDLLQLKSNELKNKQEYLHSKEKELINREKNYFANLKIQIEECGDR